MNDRRHLTGDNGSPLSPEDLNGVRQWLEERSLDALLAEAVAGIEPPDLTEPILERLARPAGPPPETARDPWPPTPFRRRSSTPNSITPNSITPNSITPISITPEPTLLGSHPGRKFAVVAVIAAAVAATLLAITSLRDPETNDHSPRLADERVEPNAEPAPLSDLAANGSGASTETTDTLPEVGGPVTAPRILVPSAEPGDPPVVSRDAVEIAMADDRAGASSAPPIRTVSRRFDTEFRSYWDAVGVTPSDDRTAESIAKLVSDRLGITLNENEINEIGDVARIRTEIVRKENAEAVASGWLDRVTEGGLARLTDSAKAEMILEMASAFRGTRRADVVLEGWLGGQSERSSDWYLAVARGGSDAMVRRLGSLTMDVDLRCTRCHDSHVERDGLQDDYWAFAAMFRRDLDRRDDGSYVVLADRTKQVDVFYDLPDGRRRLAEPGLPSRWLELDRANRANTDDGSPVTVRTWASALRGSEPLARGIVNSLWELVHGRPLQASVIDPLTAPRDAALQRLEGELAGDLIASGFDVSRTLALIITSPVTARSVLDESTEDSMFATSESTRRAVAAFAAATPRYRPLTMTRKVDIALRSVGGKIGTLGEDEKVLAQLGAQGKRNRGGKGNAAEAQIPTDFPVRAASPPVNWLDDLDDWTEKLDHLAYLSGRNRLPDDVREAVEGMRDAELDESLILHRVWWLLQR